MNPSMDDIGTAAELAQDNFFAFISWDALTQWFQPGGVHDSVVAQELVMVLFLLVFSILLVISAALLVCSGARSEAHSARSQAALQDTLLARVMLTDSGHNLREFIRVQTALRSLPENSPPLRAASTAGA